ncbi:MarR family transcriptional regulator [Vagococcus sp. BWB3-3]|uniref:MarR family transcriptional regulator n=1 Tax=Vagococcus allomyrinae TaxID=2794353 RepID=A0A940P8G1_9ENTE|nr:MarR family transcriptional regulator [Vagococcus allomyrinae]MBP1039468.1 MarR family transcriptional regulator [Vagococcus allomyrinae]
MNKEDQVMVNVRQLYNKLAWINKLKMEESLKGFQSTEVHCIEYIEKNDDSNVTQLADAFYMTRGAISKLTKKLMNKGLIERYQKPTNKKEIYFRLTDRGREVFKIHEALHQEFRERDKVILDQVSEEQLDGLLNFVRGYSQHLDAKIAKLDVKRE